jgi:hypothetical protein
MQIPSSREQTVGSYELPARLANRTCYGSAGVVGIDLKIPARITPEHETHTST